MATDTRVIIRTATRDDIPTLVDLIRPFVDAGTLLERTYDEFDDLLPNFFVAVDAETGTILGCAALEIYSRKLAEIRSLAVSAAAQGRGVGRLLVAACIAQAQENNILEIMAITSTDDFFKRCGFDYTLPGAKRALFFQTSDPDGQHTNHQSTYPPRPTSRSDSD
ncbi:MAG: GNAT family N-acetyltransferase [Chloroflexi bacterium]|nr:GNAT family N-acetyltransferase [Chloroflexota bacterium]